MFEIIAMFLHLQTGQVQSSKRENMTFTTYADCVEVIPSELERLRETLADAPVFTALGCLKTGDNS